MASHLLLLPRELRDQIYHEYLTTGEGARYVFNFESGKLRTSTNKPIDLRLSYTCKLIAEEMRGLALRAHIIEFSTIYSDDLRARLGLFCNLIDTIYQLQVDQVVTGVPFMDKGQIEEVSYRHPEILPILCPSGLPENYPVTGNWLMEHLGEAQSIGREAVRQTLQKMALVPGYAEGVTIRLEETIEESIRPWEPNIDDFFRRGRLYPSLCTWSQLGHTVDPRSVLSLPWEPWIIPTKSQVDSMIQTLQAGRDSAARNAEILTWEYWEKNGGKYRCSAATAAIHFLRSIPDHRRHIRKIVLHEDHPSVAFPECHALGLVPFCQENPKLQIERRVALWQNIFQDHPRSCLRNNWENRIFHAPQNDEAFLNATDISQSVAAWMVEASILGRAGMPNYAEAFTLVLDGDPTPERSSEVFREVVQRDAAWRDALTQIYPWDPRDLKVHFHIRHYSGYFFDAFPRLVEGLVQNKASSNIRCNFDLGEPWDVQQIVALNKGCSSREWTQRWVEDRDSEFCEPVTPLPEWAALLDENMLPRDYWDPDDRGGEEEDREEGDEPD